MGKNNDVFKNFSFESIDQNDFINLDDSDDNNDGSPEDTEVVEVVDLDDDSGDDDGDNSGSTKKDKKDNTEFIDLESLEEIEDGASDTSDSSPVLPLASALHEKGLLSSFDEEAFKQKIEEYEGDAFEALFEVIENEINQRADFINSSLTPQQKEYLTALAKGVPHSTFAENKNNEIKYDSLTDETISEDEELQESIIKDYLKSTTKFSDDKIAKLIKDKKDLGELESEALESAKELKQVYKDKIKNATKEAELENSRREEHNRKQLEEVKTNIENTKDVFGIKLNKQLQDTVYKSMTVPVAKAPDGTLLNVIAAKRAENPIEFEKKLHFLFHITKGFEDISTIKKQVKTTAVEELKNTLDGKKTTSFKSNKGSSSSKDSSFDDRKYLGELSKLMNKL